MNVNDSLQELDPKDFYAETLLDALKSAGWAEAWVEQTGGGTATIYAKRDRGGRFILGGPGSFNWHQAGKSVFSSCEFYIGESQDEVPEGMDEADWDPYLLTLKEGAGVPEAVELFEQVQTFILSRSMPPSSS